MIRFSGNERLLIVLAAVLLMYGQSFPASVLVQGRMSRGLSREEMVEMAGYGEEKLSTVLVAGSVICEDHLQDHSLLHEQPVSGALVAVQCRREGRRSRPVQTQGITDDDGEFMIDLPSQLHAIDNLQGKCFVKLLQTPHSSPCRTANLRKHVRMRLSSAGAGIRRYEAGKIKLLHYALQPLHSPA